GLSVNESSPYTSDRLLVVAMGRKKFDIAKWLIEKGADVNHRGSNRNALFYAVVHNQFPILKLMVQHGGSIKKYFDGSGGLMVEAIHVRNLEMLKYIYEQGGRLEEKSYGSNSLLHIAAQMAALDISKWLIQKGMDVNITNVEGSRPLDLALSTKDNRSFREEIKIPKEDYEKLILYLKSVGAEIGGEHLSVKAQNKWYSDLKTAAKSGNLSELKKLTERNDFPFSPNTVYVAFKAGHAEAARYLIHKYKLHSHYILRTIIDFKQMYLLPKLIEYGASLKLNNSLDSSTNLVSYAIDNSPDISIIKTLVKAGVSVNERSYDDRTGETPLHFAVMRMADYEIVQYLIQQGANPDLKANTIYGDNLSPGEIIADILKNGVYRYERRVELKKYEKEHLLRIKKLLEGK
ncbi:MAG: ankyrin repeat domain-containing protein, partial [Leptospiraceae bacterium]|nr:ankyrin repeat domain-containing protein [Leptospiraceae bacterium]